MTKWSDLTANPFGTKTYQEPVETADTIETVDLVEQAGLVDTYLINSTDGRMIPVIVDNSSRSVYPVRKKV